MKKINTLVIVFCSFLYSEDKEASVFVDGVAAIVGEHIVLKSDVAQLVNIAAVQQRLNPSTDMEKLLILQQNTVRSIIDQKIMLEMAAVDSIVVEDKEVDMALDQQIEMFVSQSGSEERAEEMLGQSLKSFRREFWYEMRDRLTTERYQQALINKINVNRDDVESFFITYKDSLPLFPSLIKTRHLLIPVVAGEESSNDVYEALVEIKKQILDGGSFEELAKLHSQDPGSRQNGGSLGYVRRGSLVPEFESVAFSQNVGVVSDIIKTQFGYHVVETEEKLGDKIKVRHILLIPKISEEDESKAYRFALTLKDSASSLADFKRLVFSHSTDKQTREIGGDLGWINPNNSPLPELSQVFSLLEIGSCSLPVRTEQGYHLFWIDSFREGGKPSLSTHWPEIENMALNYKRSQWYEGWISKARERFFIQIKAW
ncbi:MAG TPA: peptidylprolyl isomerase, partial [Alphaproteobacteria bacterium]|nr:peptidylprolyl isomerase [Alphaproteobacteria bacterium]